MGCMDRPSSGRTRRGRGTRPGTRVGRLRWAALLAGGLALTACTGDDTDPAQPPAGQSSEDAVRLAARWALTGLPGVGSVVRPHPVMVVKIDNTASSSPQIGLSSADLVAEELVEGGSTRLAAFFYSRTPRLVGPVRSMRATDIGVVKPADGVLVAAGGAPPTVSRIRSARIRTFGEGAPGFRREAGRSAPYNLFVDLAALARTVPSNGAPRSYLPWGSDEDLPRGAPARGLTATFSGAHSTRWRFRDDGYANLGSFALAGDRFRPDTVLVLRVPVGDAGYLDPAGNPVPETKLTGQGKALIFHGGRLVRATWSKQLDTTIRLRSSSGEVHMPPGKVWIELVPARTGSVTVSR
jgi:hypothetical protein